MKMYELIPTNGRKSFYGKARVMVEDNGTETLYSYDTAIISVFPAVNLSDFGRGGVQQPGGISPHFAG